MDVSFVLRHVIQTLSVAFAGLALAHTIDNAMLTEFIKTDLPLFRPPKQAGKQALVKALQAAREETFLFSGLCLASGTSIFRLDVESLDLPAWSIMLLV